MIHTKWRKENKKMAMINGRIATWRRIGTDVKTARDVDEVLKLAHLDYKVYKRQAFYNFGGKQHKNEGYFNTVRMLDDGKTPHAYGVVKSTYQIVQNRDAFGFVDYLDDRFIFEKAGELPRRDGKPSGTVYIIGRLPEVNILGDAFTPNLIIMNDFSGSRSINALIVPLRLICENQIPWALKESDNCISIRHFKSAKEKLKQAVAVEKEVILYMDTLNSMAEGYAAMKVSPHQIDMILDAMFPVDPTDPPKKVQNLVKKREEFKEAFYKAYNEDDNYSFRGTAWGMFNAYADIMTHDRTNRTTPESDFASATFGEKKKKALDFRGYVLAVAA